MADRQYFASLPSEEITEQLHDRAEKYYDYLGISGQFNVWKSMYDAYYAGSGTGHSISRDGELGQYSKINVNHLRNLVTHIYVLTTQQQLSFNSRARNADSRSQRQAILNNDLLEFYQREKKMDRRIDAAVESAVLLGEGFVSTTWDSRKGQGTGTWDPSTGQQFMEGDIVYRAHNSLDVIRDYSKESWDENNWVQIRRAANRFDLIARYPEMADKLLSAPSKYESQLHRRYFQNAGLRDEDTDDVCVMDFYHEKTDAVPDGRFVSYVGPDCLLMDGPLNYSSLPIARISAGEKSGTIHGHTIAFDLMPIQMAISGLYSTILTNQSTFGVQSILIPAGASITVKQVMEGLNFIKYSGTVPPSPLNLTQTPREIFEFLTLLEKVAETLSGVNSVARGNPEASLKSGAALALVQSMAIQFNSQLQKNYKNLAQDVAIQTTRVLQQRAQTERVAMIAGKSNKSGARVYSAADISDVDSVTVEVGNALSRTVSGKVQLAEMCLQYGIIKDQEQLFSILDIGQFENISDAPQSERLNIRSENERLAEGGQVFVVPTDNPILHIQEHCTVLDSPEARENPNIVMAVHQHIMDHCATWSTLDPLLLAAKGIPPPPMVGMPTATAGGQGAPSAVAPGGAAPGSPPPSTGSMDPNGMNTGTPGLPNAPTNPLTGQPAPMPEGSAVN